MGGAMAEGRHGAGMTDDQEAVEVLRLGRAIGFGRLMQLASEEWNKLTPGGAFAVGPCIAMTQPCDCRRRKNGHCIDCSGCGWVMKP